MDRTGLQQLLAGYQTPYPVEQAYVPRMLTLLDDPLAYSRERLAGHFTASAWVVNEAHSHALLLLHRKLNRWLQPGGHADGNENLRAVAAKELFEETGLNAQPQANAIFDLDIHEIPERKGVPAHLHYDVRFLFIVPQNSVVTINEESKAVNWQPLPWLAAEYAADESIGRMVNKVTALV